MKKSCFSALLVFLGACYSAHHVTLNANFSKANKLNVLSDSLYFESKTNDIDSENIAYELARLFNHEGFRVVKDKRDATVIVDVSKNEEVKTFSETVSVPKSSTLVTGRARGYASLAYPTRATEITEYSAVTREREYRYYNIRATFFKDGKEIINSFVLIERDLYNKEYTKCVKELFNMLKRGEEVKEKKERW